MRRRGGPLPAPLSPPIGTSGERGYMPARPRRIAPTAAFLVAVLGAAAVMVSPLTTWTAAVVACGAATAAAGSTVGILLLLHRWR